MTTQQPTASTTSLSRLQELLPQLFQATQLQGQPYLRFLLTEGIEALMSMVYVQESLIVPAEQITLLPNLPRSVLGLMSSREQVFCLVNLPQLLGYPCLVGPQRRYRVIVVRVPGSKYQAAADGEALLGLAVLDIQGVTRFSEEQLQTATPLCPANLQPYVTGGCQQDGQLTYILHPPAIATAPALYPS
ncbi:chemotaxis protein CheW [Acaryochloris sp. IP29b_bin.148]|uniref:chemotaxis protein CheW n=1 Tax=Acaryochloris sp. IP29b_bin.148 TaxID=2969218 RepID=UPI002609672E|nr:chemotaxis protein CheW [Acaryochloris sp. IP29b_bin.148]